jgi:hypothetical protein
LGDAEIMHWENRLNMIYNAGEAEIMHQAMYIGRHILYINTALFFIVSEYKANLLTFCSFSAGGRYFRLKSKFYYRDHKVKSSSKRQMKIMQPYNNFRN